MQITLYSISEFTEKSGLAKADLIRDCVDSRGASALPQTTLFRLARSKNGMIGVDEEGNPVMLVIKSKRIRMRPSQQVSHTHPADLWRRP